MGLPCCAPPIMDPKLSNAGDTALDHLRACLQSACHPESNESKSPHFWGAKKCIPKARFAALPQRVYKTPSNPGWMFNFVVQKRPPR